MEYFVTIVPIVISLVSLLISIKAIRQQTPKIKILIQDAFYGGTKVVNHNGADCLSHYVAGARMRIYNPSSSSVMIAEMSLVLAGTSYDLADCKNEYWSELVFYFVDGNEITSDGSCVDYASSGISVPFLLGAHETKDVVCIFMSFPKSNNKIIRGEIGIDTAIGRIRKPIKLKLYDKSYSLKEWDDIDKFQRSL